MNNKESNQNSVARCKVCKTSEKKVGRYVCRYSKIDVMVCEDCLDLYIYDDTTSDMWID